MLLAKVGRFAGYSILAKRTPKNDLYQRTKIGITSLWEDLEDKLLTQVNYWAIPENFGDITVQTSYM